MTVSVPASFANLAPLDGLFLFNETTSDTAGQPVPASLTWNPAVPYDFSAFAVAADVGGIPRCVDSGGTIVSPTCALSAFHAGGTKFYWRQSNGTEINRTLTATDKLGDTDICICRWTTPITTITPMPILLNPERAAGRQALAVEADRHLNLVTLASDLSVSNPFCEWTPTSADLLETGDSGKPVVVGVNGALAMACSGVGGPLGGPNPSHFISEINAILAADGEALTLWRLVGGVGGSVRSSIQSSIYQIAASSLVSFPQGDEDD